ncbi:uncharacterized protein LOC129806870 [Phlebotomus papatasi]|uniref:uncharacterized protein LOC129803616 n=1 Tax=Phlebotomus papatasi TaxID=29031 RepID=UPI002483334A|nr:uncharacterized protein LOC129803616 [Phlebotomus papatasi]XP_055711654.1 uncharacterized protein LOC129806870 [Phlebotomus papatasi]
MGKNTDNSDVKKRVRKHPVRKWDDECIKLILEHLKENIPIEKPTARQYYTRFCDLYPELQIEDPDLVRQKVVHLKTKYIQVEQWRNESGNGVKDGGETINEILNRKCPFYTDLDEIFSQKKSVRLQRILDSGNDESVQHFRAFTQKSVTAKRPTTTVTNNSSQIETVAPHRLENFVPAESPGEDEDIVISLTDVNPGTSNMDDNRRDGRDISTFRNNLSNCADHSQQIDEPDDSDEASRPAVCEAPGKRLRGLSGTSSSAKKKRKITSAGSMLPGIDALAAERKASTQMRVEFEKEKLAIESSLEDRRLSLMEMDIKAKIELEKRKQEFDERIRLQELKYKYGITENIPRDLDC